MREGNGTGAHGQNGGEVAAGVQERDGQKLSREGMGKEKGREHDEKKITPTRYLLDGLIIMLEECDTASTQIA